MCRIVNVGLCVCAVCNWDGSRQSNNHRENSTKLPGYLWGKCFYNISFNLWAQYNLQVLKSSFNHSTLDIYSSSETCGPWRDQAAVHDATFWNQQSQQDAAVQYSTRSKQLFYFFSPTWFPVENTELSTTSKLIYGLKFAMDIRSIIYSEDACWN